MKYWVAGVWRGTKLYHIILEQPLTSLTLTCGKQSEHLALTWKLTKRFIELLEDDLVYKCRNMNQLPHPALAVHQVSCDVCGEVPGCQVTAAGGLHVARVVEVKTDRL